MSNPALNLGALEVIFDPVAARILAERCELFRIAGQNALDRSRGGRDLDPEARAWAQHYAGFKPLGRALGTGEPVACAPEVSA